ncbi:glycosyltransferase family 2 protein [Paenibacillus sp.]|uniref:glycosyltransferase family 2 protein n=1 Tax=Paenibacillus sp. TaxID=58172 RepID=UPI002D3ECE7B|nr:glycosyltransferase [Paenibacillus sp.]HZG58288.1 glycosyltransferase [Paenibacillus sp.]
MVRTLSVIIPAKDEAGTLYDVVTACKHVNPLEIIVVANGCTDNTAAIARRLGCRVLEFAAPLGHDVGRAVGAKAARGDILLFLDADVPIRSGELRDFLEPIAAGRADVVLNNMDPLFARQRRPHSTTVWRQIANAMVRRDDLNIDSLLSIPHAMTKEAAQAVGYARLANPIHAHLLAAGASIRIDRTRSIDVIANNRYRPEQHDAPAGRLSNSEQRIIGDHLAALSAVWNDPRGGFSDGGRRRDIVKRIQSGALRMPVVAKMRRQRVSALYGGQKLSVVIPAQNEEATIGAVIREARKIEPAEIIVVVNGSKDRTTSIAIEEGATVLHFAERLGNDVGRAIGAMAATGDVLLFIDGDFAIPAAQLYPYAKAVSTGIDLALNDLNHYLDIRFPYNVVTACKYGVNLALDRKPLGVGSFIAVPHAVHRTAADRIGRDAFLSPVKAQVQALLLGCSAANVARTEVDRMNRIRPEEHFAAVGHPPAVERIIGDHIEGIHALTQAAGDRGLFGRHDRNLNLAGL